MKNQIKVFLLSLSLSAGFIFSAYSHGGGWITYSDAYENSGGGWITKVSDIKVKGGTHTSGGGWGLDHEAVIRVQGRYKTTGGVWLTVSCTT